jgi:hypothetical protein
LLAFYLKRRITDGLASSTGKSREREIAVLYPAEPTSTMKMRDSAPAIGLPLRTLMICFTIWLIATEVLVFDQVKFNARTELLEQTARALRGPEVVVPSRRPSDLSGAKMEIL